MGFLCGGIGVCQTCISCVTKGNEQLNPVTEVEQKSIRKVWLDSGHRMACQATVQGPGPIEIVTRAEQMRRETLDIFTLPEGTTPLGNVGVLFNHIGRIFANQLALWPANAVAVVNQVVKNPPTPRKIMGVLSDTVRVSQRMITGNGAAAEQVQQAQPPQQAQQAQQPQQPSLQRLPRLSQQQPPSPPQQRK
jgi:hypothetical protein